MRYSITYSVLLCFIAIRSIHSFASWLQCYIDLDESEVIMNHEVQPPDENQPAVIEFRKDDETDWVLGLTYADSKPTTVHARLKLPQSLSKQDVQYVIETTEGGAFVGGICDGKIRAHATDYSKEVTLEVDGTQEKVEVWGGWATGHEAVTLTPRSILWREGSQPVEEL